MASSSAQPHFEHGPDSTRVSNMTGSHEIGALEKTLLDIDVQPQPESPTSKSLREEQELRASRNDDLYNSIESAKILARPQSSGIDVQTNPFMRQPRQTQHASPAIRSPHLPSFAPVHLARNIDRPHTAGKAQAGDAQSQRCTVRRADEKGIGQTAVTTIVASSKQARPTLSAANNASPEKTERSNPDHSPAPKLPWAEPVDADLEVISITSRDSFIDTGAQSNKDGVVNDTASPTDDPVSAGEDTTESMAKKPSPGANSKLSVNASEFHHQSYDTDGRCSRHKIQRGTTHRLSSSQPSSDRASRSSSACPASYRQKPSRVSKASHAASSTPQAYRQPLAPGESQVLSDEDMYMIQLYRYKQMKDNLSKSDAKIRTLVARNNRLQKQSEALDTQLKRFYEEKTELSGKNELLQNQIMDFRTRYHKVKDMAKSFSTDLVHLRQGADAQESHLQALRHDGRINQESIQTIRSAVSTTELKLKDNGKSIAAARRETDNALLTIRFMQEGIATKDAQLIEEQRRSKRLEAHVTEVSGTQQRLNNTITNDCKTLVQWMHQVHSSLDGMRTCVADSSLAPDIAESFKILRQLWERPSQQTEISPEIVNEIHDAIMALLNLSKKNQEESSRSLDNILDQIKDPAASLTQPMTEILAAVRGLGIDLDKAQETERRNSELAGKYQALDRELAQQKDESAERNKCILAAVSVCQELVLKAKQKPAADDQEESQLRLKYQSAASNLASAKSSLAKANDEKDELSQNVHDLQIDLQRSRADLEEFQKQAVKQLEELKTSHQAMIDNETSKLQAEIEELQTSVRQQEAQRDAATTKADRQKLALSQQKDQLEQSRMESSRLLEANAKLERGLTNRLNEVEKLTGVAAQLAATKDNLAAASKELGRLRSLEATQADLCTENNNLKRTIEDQSTKLANQDRDLLSLKAEVNQSPGLQSAVNELEQARAGLARQLEHAKDQASATSRLREQLKSNETHIAALTSEIGNIRPLEGQLRSSREENERLVQELDQVRNKLAQAQDQLNAASGWEAQIKAKDDLVAQLRQQLAQASEVRTNLMSLNEESQRKDSQIVELTNEIQRYKIESQGTQRLQTRLPAELVRPLEGSPGELDESDLPADLAEQLITSQDLPEGLARRAKTPPQELRSRRVADRSAKPRTRQSHSAADSPEILETQAPSQGPNVIPNSQEFDNQLLGQAIVPLDDDGPDSPLTDLENIPEPDSVSDSWLYNGTHTQTVDNSLNSRDDGLPPPQTPLRADRMLIRPPSSAMSEDLFRKHENSLEGSEYEPRQRYSGQTVAPIEVLRGPPDFAQQSRKLGSPRRLRNGTQLGPEAFSQPEAIQTTPPVNRDRPPPNSGAKRHAEDDLPSSPGLSTKRRKRNLENIRVKEAKEPTSSQPKSSVTLAARQGRSVVGSGAPAPATTSRRSTKAQRKDSSEERFKRRFNPQG